MKQVLTLIFAGMIGGLITLAGTTYLQSNNTAEISSLAKQINHPINIPATATAVPFDFVKAAELATPAVVHIKASESVDLAQQRRQSQRQRDPFSDFFGMDFFSPFHQQPKEGTGSGVIISDDGYIVTNNHVVGFADEVEVTLFDNRTFRAEVVGTYPKADLAVIKIEAYNLPVLENADSEAARVGEWVMAIGNPLELNSTVTAGIISAKGRQLNIIEEGQGIESFIQTDAVVNPGNSGGALIDANGRLLGINTAIKTPTGYYAGYSFAIPVNLMKKITDDIIDYGSFQRAYLGISIYDLDNEFVETHQLDISQGVVIAEIETGGSAEFAGLLPDDVIVKVDDKSIRNAPELQEVVGSAKVGETIMVKVNRKGETLTIPVRLKTAG